MLSVVMVFLITGCTSSTNSDTNDESANNEAVQAVREKESYDELIINKSDVTEVAKFYPVIVNGTKMEVIVVRATDGTIRTAFNACQVCATSGRGYYIQVGHKLVCQNCGNEFDIDDLEQVHGGCNPAPITKNDKTEDNDFIKIPKSTFENNINLFNY
jgi:uncharacterized membrane protein